MNTLNQLQELLRTLGDAEEAVRYERKLRNTVRAMSEQLWAVGSLSRKQKRVWVVSASAALAHKHAFRAVKVQQQSINLRPQGTFATCEPNKHAACRSRHWRRTWTRSGRLPRAGSSRARASSRRRGGPCSTRGPRHRGGTQKIDVQANACKNSERYTNENQNQKLCGRRAVAVGHCT